MINKCINCCKWITCKNTSEDEKDCKNFKSKRIQITKYEKEIKNDEKGKRDKKEN